MLLLYIFLLELILFKIIIKGVKLSKQMETEVNMFVTLNNGFESARPCYAF
jgi:hypothetical protein